MGGAGGWSDSPDRGRGKDPPNNRASQIISNNMYIEVSQIGLRVINSKCTDYYNNHFVPQPLELDVKRYIVLIWFL